jgi:hypothetical protein
MIVGEVFGQSQVQNLLNIILGIGGDSGDIRGFHDRRGHRRLFYYAELLFDRPPHRYRDSRCGNQDVLLAQYLFTLKNVFDI